MGSAALAEPLAIKISSKRQITIPAKAYEEAGFKDYALCTWTDKGMFLQPLDVEDEDVTIDILRYLINEGYEGEDLIAQYKAMKKKVVSVKDTNGADVDLSKFFGTDPATEEGAEIITEVADEQE